MKSYKALNNQIYNRNNYSIIPIRMQDMESIRLWRNSQMDVLRQNKKISYEDQVNYFNSVVEPLFKSENPEQLLFSYFHNSELIGYGGLVHISWSDKRAEISFLVDIKRSEKNALYNQDFQIFIELMKELCFDEMKFNRIFTETYAFRTFHISILERAGLIEEGRLRQHIIEKNKYYDSIYHSILKEEHNEK